MWCTVPLKCKLPPSRETRLVSLEMHLVSLETHLISFKTSLVSLEKFLVSRKCTVSINFLPSGECTNGLVSEKRPASLAKKRDEFPHVISEYTINTRSSWIVLLFCQLANSCIKQEMICLSLDNSQITCKGMRFVRVQRTIQRVIALIISNQLHDFEITQTPFYSLNR